MKYPLDCVTFKIEKKTISGNTQSNYCYVYLETAVKNALFGNIPLFLIHRKTHIHSYKAAELI
jgi:hypothetical protein